MEIQKIDVGFEIKKIVHVSDIHIRNVKRHSEYKKVFGLFYRQLRALKKEDPNFIIYVAGDIAHSKTEMSPELISMISTFLRTLANINPTIVILGNHDCNLNNESRLDVLTPIIHNMRQPNLYYFRDTGLYEMNNIMFSVLSAMDNKNTDVPYIETDKVKIALYHGPLVNAQTDVGFKVTRGITASSFNNHDIVMLGDIHKLQCINESSPLIVYAGSMIQQNHSESYNNHGYVLWDLTDNSYKHIELLNEYGYYTLTVIDGNYNDPLNLSKHTRVRIKYSDTPISRLKEISSVLKQNYGIHDITLHKNDVSSTANHQSTENIIGNIRDVNVQNSLISEYISDNFSVSDDVIEKIQALNALINTKIPPLDSSRGVVWKLKELEFSNMFSYGEKNKINFSDMNGIIGLFAPNTSGKSSILDIISYCLFDRFSKGTKGGHILNYSKSNLYCKLTFTIGDTDYVIERIGKRILKSSDRVKIDVNFYSISSDGITTILNGDDKHGTNRNIRSYIGTYEDFILTAASLQNNPSTFIDKSQADRKNILTQFLDLDVYEQLYQIALEESKGISAILKEFKKTDFNTQLAINNIKLSSLEPDYESKQEEQNILITSLEKYNNEIITLTQKLNKIIDIDIDIESHETQRETLKNLLLQISRQIQNNDNELQQLQKKLNIVVDELITYDIDSIESKYNILKEKQTERQNILNNIDKHKVHVQHKLDKISKLQTHEYNPECEYCINNSFVQDALNAKESLNKDKQTATDLLEQLHTVNTDISEHIKYDTVYNDILNLQQQQNQIKNNILTVSNEAKELKLLFSEKNEKYNSIIKSIELYYQNIQYITENKLINEKISSETHQKNITQDQIGLIGAEIKVILSDIAVLKADNKTLTESISSAKEYEQQYLAYDYLLKCINRNGIPYSLIKKSIPTIQTYTNNVLSQITDFTIKFELEDKDINLYIVYADDRYWLLDLASGMEKFIASLAIRNALTHITTLSKTTMLAIDEGLGVLDSDNFNSIFYLFDYLKTQFDFILIISHIEQAKDIVDTLLDIKKINGFSKIEV